MILQFHLNIFRPALMLGIVAALGLTAGLVGAQAPAPVDKEETKKKEWNTGINAGLNYNQGNSETIQINGGILSEYKKNANELRLSLQGAYGESALTKNSASNKTAQTTVQNARGIAEYRRLVNEYNYIYVNGDAKHDQMAGIDYRLVAGPGFGRYFLKKDIQTLSAEAGLAYVCQRLSGDVNDSINLRLAQRYAINLLTGSKLWESIELLPAITDPSNYFFNFEIGAEAAMTARLSLRIVLQDQYNNRPAKNKQQNNLQLIAGVGYKL